MNMNALHNKIANKHLMQMFKMIKKKQKTLYRSKLMQMHLDIFLVDT